MGWWQISTDYAGLSFGLPKPEPKPEPKPGEPVLYNGDEPADAAGALWKRAKTLLTPRQFADALATGKLPRGFGIARLERGLSETRAAIEACYLREWNRPPYPAEWRGVAAFVAGEPEPEE